MKFCKDCRWVDPQYYTKSENDWECLAPEHLVISPLSGEKTKRLLVFCCNARSTETVHNQFVCGVNGRYWQMCGGRHED